MIYNNATNIFLCDQCDCLAQMSVRGDTITISKCKCPTLEWENE